MGLDTVELLMEVEEHFGITLKETDYSGLVTVDDLTGLIRSRIDTANVETCVTRSTFFSLRRLVREIIGNDSSPIRPRDDLATLLSPVQLRILWNRLPELLQTTPPSLRRSPRLRNTLVTISLIALFIACPPVSAFYPSIGSFIPVRILIASLLIYAMNRMTLGYRNYPPENWITMGDVTRRIVSTFAATQKLHLHDSNAVFLELRSIIVEQLNVKPENIVRTSRFIEDLKMD